MNDGWKLRPGDPVPDFELADTEGRPHRLSEVAGPAATVVVWTCNHCPYALAWHDRIVDVARDYGDRGIAFLAVNSNDAERYPADSLEAMRDRIGRERWPFPYLHDPTQEAAKAFGARVTPDVFVLDPQRRLRYRGAPDADHSDPNHGGAWLRQALDHVIAGERPPREETEPVGCSVKWKPG
jgi:peroxiredoxin